MFAIRGIVFCHETVREREAKLTPTLAEDLRRRRHGRVGCSWYVVKVHGRWCYLHRAIDRAGALVDVMFSEQRDGDVIFFDSHAPHVSKPNFIAPPRRLLYLTYNLASQGDHRGQYYADKRASFPPDIERETGKSYVFRV